MTRAQLRVLLLSGASAATVLGAPDAAFAQDTAAATDAAVADAIVVTGTRVKRDGYDAPTPVTVVGAEAIAKAAPVNVADYVNQLPQLSPSATPRVGNGATSTGTAGLNLLDLRGLGSNRTLVMVDGQRVAPSTQTGAVDINNIPTALLSRVDVVTGGASAAYGSDAVAGVVNFVIDRKFKGIKLNLLGGVTDRNDNRNWQVSGAFGTSFAEDRGHLLLAAEHQHEDGIDMVDPAKRKWYNATYLVPNPAYTATNGQPRQIVASNVNYSNVALGGLITTGPLRGTAFGPGGTPYQFNFGTLAVNSTSPTSNFMIGGNTWNEGNVATINPRIDRTNVWGRLSYDLTDAITASVEGSYGRTHTDGHAAYQRYTGPLTVGTRSVANPLVSVPVTTPFLPASVLAAATTAGVTSFGYGMSTIDYGRMENDITRENMRLVGTLSGNFSDKWSWQAYYQYGRSNIDVQLHNTTNNAKFLNAVDAVRNSSGAIVCRSTLTDPTNGCVAANIFGTGVISPESLAYFKGTAWQKQRITENVVAASVSGSLGNTWAGPISLAAGAEHRTEHASAVGDALSQTNSWATGNFKTNAGGYNVTEGFGEVVVPLLKDSKFGSAADFNGAIRVTHYSLAGTVTTWKTGLTYQPVQDLKLRVVVSRDIRAPSIADGFAAGATQAVDVIVPNQAPNLYTSGTWRITQVTNGNPNLTPEKADTFSLGAVLKPRLLPGFSASVDYYNIRVKSAIQTLTVNDIVTLCYAGVSDACALITADPVSHTITQIARIPINVASIRVRGIDFDASYRTSLGKVLPGEMSLRFIGTKTLNYTLNTGITTTEYAGMNGGPLATISAPKWRTYTTLGYDNDRASLTMTMRTVSAGVYSNTWKSGVDIDNNTIKGVTYFDLGGTYRITGDRQHFVEAYFKVDNLFDRAPAVAALNVSSALQTNPTLYDVVGRSYRIGVRLRY